MWKLLRKDLIFNRRMLAGTYLFHLLLLSGFAMRDHSLPVPLYAGFAAVMCGFLPLSLVAREEKFRTAAFTCSLPVTRQAVVSARYVGGGLIAFLGAGLILALGYLVPQIGLAGRGVGPGAPLLVAFAVVGVVQAGLLPFTIRFGLVGLMVFLVAAQVLGMLVMLLAVFTGGGTIRGVLDGWAAALHALHAALGDAATAGAVVAGVLLLNLVSHRISCWLFRRRQL